MSDKPLTDAERAAMYERLYRSEQAKHVRTSLQLLLVQKRYLPMFLEEKP